RALRPLAAAGAAAAALCTGAVRAGHRHPRPARTRHRPAMADRPDHRSRPGLKRLELMTRPRWNPCWRGKMTFVVAAGFRRPTGGNCTRQACRQAMPQTAKHRHGAGVLERLAPDQLAGGTGAAWL